jgi:hypothetical protein
MVLMRRLSRDEMFLAEKGDIDYSIFMAVAEKIGHDKRGVALKVMPCDRHSCISILSSRLKCLFFFVKSGIAFSIPQQYSQT